MGAAPPTPRLTSVKATPWDRYLSHRSIASVDGRPWRRLAISRRRAASRCLAPRQPFGTSSTRAARPPERCRGQTPVAPEEAGEMALVVEAGAQSDHRDGLSS